MKREQMNSPESLPDQVSQVGASLRQRAEEHLKQKRTKENVPQAEADTIKLLHELEVYEIELEMQNEELRLTRDKAETASEKYTAIYDFACTGYFTLDPDTKICELNLSGARMLGKDRSSVRNRNFNEFVTSDTIPYFNDFFRKVFETNSKETCEVRLIVKAKPSIITHIEGIVSADEQQCLLTAVDITKHKHAEEILKLKDHEYDLFNDLMITSDRQLIELKKEINSLLNKLGEKEKFKIEEQ
jgi:PAS domain S-box-containing protein